MVILVEEQGLDLRDQEDGGAMDKGRELEKKDHRGHGEHGVGMMSSAGGKT